MGSSRLPKEPFSNRTDSQKALASFDGVEAQLLDRLAFKNGFSFCNRQLAIQSTHPKQKGGGILEQILEGVVHEVLRE